MRYRPQRNRRPSTRFDVALAQRAQRQPRRVARAPLALFGGLLALILAVVGARWYTGDDWRLNAFEVRNNTGVPVEAIIGASGLQGEHFQSADLNKAAAAIDDLPGVEAAQVTCTWEWRARCEILIQPARAMVFWESARGNVWNDYEGKVQRAMDAIPAKVTVFVEDGEPPALTERIDPRLLRALNELTALQPDVERYLYDAQYGLIWMDGERWRVRLGVADYDGAMSDKIKLARALRQQLEEQGVRVRVLDVRFVGAPYYIVN